MTRKTKYIDTTSSISRKFATRRNDMNIANDFRVSNIADIEAFRLIRLNANNELEKADHNSPSCEGVLHKASTASAGSIADYISHGHARFIANSAVEVGEIKAAEDGRICGFVRALSGGRTILAATAGEAGEITDTDANDELIKVSSTSASDTNYLLVFGKQKTTGTAIMEYLHMQGKTAVNSSYYYDEVWGAIILDEANLEGTPTDAAGTVTVKNVTSGTTLITISAAANNAAVNTVTSEYAFDRRVYVTIDTLAAANTQLVGYDYKNDETIETITHTATNGVVKMQSTTRWNRIIYEVCGGVADARTIAIAAANNEDIADGYTNNTHQTTTDDAADQGDDSTIEIVSSDNSDTTQKVTVAWKNAAGTWSVTTKTLNGTTHVQVTAAGDTVVGAYLDSNTAGTVSIIYDRSTANTTVLAWDGSSYLGAGMLSTWEGNAEYSGLELDARNSTVTLTCSNSSAADILYIKGEDVDGSSQGEGLTLSSGAATTTNKYSRITHIFCSGTESTEHFRIHNGTDDDGSLRIGKLLQPADAQGDVVEGIFY